jgi:hypothetical protein
MLFKGDIYALGLVFWEIVNRVEKRGEKEEEERIYQPPYWDMVGIDPSLDEMRKVRSGARVLFLTGTCQSQTLVQSLQSSVVKQFFMALCQFCVFQKYGLRIRHPGSVKIFIFDPGSG